MTDPSDIPSGPPPGRNMRGGGCLVAAGLLIGTVVGIVLREPSVGVLAGFALGIAGAAIFTLFDRRR